MSSALPGGKPKPPSKPKPPTKAATKKELQKIEAERAQKALRSAEFRRDLVKNATIRQTKALQSIQYSNLEKFVEQDGFFRTKLSCSPKGHPLTQQASPRGQEGDSYRSENEEEGDQTPGHRAVLLGSSSAKFAGQ